MVSTSDAILFCNTGSRLLVEGRYTNAMKMFEKSLKVLKLSKRSRSADIATTTTTLPFSFDDCISMESSSDDEIESSSSFVCREPIFMDTNDEEESDFLRIFATIVFNLALVYHLQGLRCQCPSALEKASALYEVCLKIQIKNRFDLGDYTKLLVIPNNLGHVNMKLGRTKRAQGYMKFLSRQLATYYSSTTSSSSTLECPTTTNNNTRNLEGFYHNVSFLCMT
eukprot:scaffold6803_cov60-Cylindrotheca_fusiformis.AAC.6